MEHTFSNKEEFKRVLRRRVIETYGRSIEEAHKTETYMVLGQMVRDFAGAHWKDSKDAVARSQEKQMYYFSMEFLLGRLLMSNLMNLGVYDLVKDGLIELGLDIHEIEELESDAGLGNGGLGRLAACFLDSLASLRFAGHGNCIRYEYGFFKQKIVNNEQVEVPDQWLLLGNVWEVRKPKHAVDIKFGGHVDMRVNEQGKMAFQHIPDQVIRAVPYDMPVVGYHTKVTNTLRLWKAEISQDGCNSHCLKDYMNDVRELCETLYPDDSCEHGKKLRLKQQYFFVAAGLHSIIQSHLRIYQSLDHLSDKVAIQLNDTHPVLCIPELMRLLVDDYAYSWEDAWEITTKTMAYTNHTVLSEALEKWPISYVRSLLPRIFMIIEEIDRRFRYDLSHKYQQNEWIERFAIIKDGQVHMAHLAIVGSHTINGVAKLHTDILMRDVMKDFFLLMPHKFQNKTNGITHRRWLLYSNPQLTQLLRSTIGDGFLQDPQQLERLMKYVDDIQLQEAFLEVKKERKQLLADYIKETQGIDISVHTIFDVQAKRLHAYKRQLLNILHIIGLYLRMKEDASYRIYPRTFLFAAKAAPSYAFAKEVIKLIHCVADTIRRDLEIKKYINIVFIENYGVSIAERLMNAADVSQQISTAGKEASGTGNMKFMMNGAITLGTMDGANVEIVDRVGMENAEIFGLHAEDVLALKHNQTYNAWTYYHEDTHIQKVVDSLINGTFSTNTNDFRGVYNELMSKNDEYMLFADYHAYCDAQKRVEARYRDSHAWARMCLINIAKSGYFSSDRTIQQYADEIWQLRPVMMK